VARNEIRASVKDITCISRRRIAHVSETMCPGRWIEAEREFIKGQVKGNRSR